MVVLLLTAVTGIACGDSPGSPSGDLAGQWSGTWQFRTAGVTVTEEATVTLAQTGSEASGTWTADSGPTGQLAFVVGESFTGTFTISQTLLTGQVCTGTTTIAGTTSASRLDFTVGPLTAAGLCQWATEMQFSLRR